MINPQDVIALLPDWLRGGASAGLFVISCVIAYYGWKAGLRKGETEHESREHDDALEVREALAAGPVRDGLSCLATMAGEMKAISTAVAALTVSMAAIADTLKDDFDERRIEQEAERRAEEKMRWRELSRAAA